MKIAGRKTGDNGQDARLPAINLSKPAVFMIGTPLALSRISRSNTLTNCQQRTGNVLPEEIENETC